MATRARKRIHALQRAPDGIASHKCEHCGISVAIALVDMHECGLKKGAKRRKVEIQESFSREKIGSVEGLNIDDQPRSPFFFLECIKKTCQAEKLLDINQRGFDAWRNMSEEERRPYVVQAERVDSAYIKILLEESNNMSEDYTDYSGSLPWMKLKRSKSGYKGSSPWSKFKRSDCFDSCESHDWDELDTRFDD